MKASDLMLHALLRDLHVHRGEKIMLVLDGVGSDDHDGATDCLSALCLGSEGEGNRN